jgi:hypothetical protein
MSKFRNPQVLFLALALIALAALANAEVPQLINYQGRLTDDGGNSVADGQYNITFKIWNVPVGSITLPVWIGTPQAVQVTDGLFNCQIGPIPSSVFSTGAERYLGITVGTDDEIEPRTQLVSVPYAYHAVVADSASGTGWKYNGNYLCMENIDDSVLIGTDTAKGKLTVYNSGINSTGILGHGAAGVYGETFHHLASGVRGMNRQNSATGSLGGPYCGVSGTNGGNPDISAGCFSGLVEVYNGTIEIGGHLEDFTGTILTVRDDDNEGYAGISFGQDADNRGWMAYDNEGDYVYFGTKENGVFAPNKISMKGGDPGIGTDSPNYDLDVRGTIGNNTTLYHSDKRWKRDILKLDGSLDKVLQLQGVQYKWKQDDYPEMNFPDGEQIGLIAQDVEKVIPEVVNDGADGYKSIDYAKLVSVLIESVKEQQEQIEKLSQRVTELEGIKVSSR